MAIDDNRDVEDIFRKNKNINMKGILLDDAVFWKRIEKYYSILIPISKWLTYFERSEATISRVVECFFEINLNFTNDTQDLPISKGEEEKLLEHISSRTKKTLKPIHFAANLLEPSLKGKNLTEEQRIKGIECIYNITQNHQKYVQYSDEIMEALADYQATHGLFAKGFVKQNQMAKKPGRVWWSGICASSKLSILAVDVLELPVTSAATERSFST